MDSSIMAFSKEFEEAILRSDPVFVKKKREICFSTSEARQKFAEIIQDTYGDKAIVAFERYGKPLGALVPMEALLLLAGGAHGIDSATEGRVRDSAYNVLVELGLVQPSPHEAPGGVEVIGISDIDRQRKIQKKKAI